MLSYDVKIPKDRIAVLIGKDGGVKEDIEHFCECELHIDSKEGDIQITGEDGLLLYTAQQIVKAIARGFNPDIALRLLKQDWLFELIDLSDYSTRQNQQERMKGRVIGAGGKSRSTIENLTDASISVYGKTIGIIAPVDSAGDAKKAVEELLGGAQHAGVFKFLERQKRNKRLGGMLGTRSSH